MIPEPSNEALREVLMQLMSAPRMWTWTGPEAFAKAITAKLAAAGYIIVRRSDHEQLRDALTEERIARALYGGDWNGVQAGDREMFRRRAAALRAALLSDPDVA